MGRGESIRPVRGTSLGAEVSRPVDSALSAARIRPSALAGNLHYVPTTKWLVRLVEATPFWAGRAQTIRVPEVQYRPAWPEVGLGGDNGSRYRFARTGNTAAPLWQARERC